MMDLSPAEEMIIGLLRGEQQVDFVLNVAWLGPKWTVSVFAEGDGLLAGSGDSFRQALCAAFNVESDPDGGVPIKPLRKLRLVAGNESVRIAQ